MANPFVGQIISVGFNFAPIGWFLCDGSVQDIAQYDTLYTLIGTTYGGNGTTTFGLPDLRGRAPLCMGTGTGLSPYVQGQQTGTEQVTLTANNTPLHTHSVSLSVNPATTDTPVTGFTVGTNVQSILNGFYAAGPANQPLSSATFKPNLNGGAPHENRQSFLVLNYIISWAGIYPSLT
jgi:microcystin-dependent protein